MTGGRTAAGVILLLVGVADVGWLTTVLVPEALARSRADTPEDMLVVDASAAADPRGRPEAAAPEPPAAVPAIVPPDPPAAAPPEPPAAAPPEPPAAVPPEPPAAVPPEPPAEVPPEPPAPVAASEAVSAETPVDEPGAPDEQDDTDARSEVETPPEPQAESAPIPETVVVSFRRTGSDRLSPQSRRQLTALVRVLRARPDLRLTAVGHTDQRGSPAVNERLARRRAKAVAAYLRRRGIPKSRVTIVSAGDTQPIADGTDVSSLAKNRRVEIELHRGTTDQE